MNKPLFFTGVGILSVEVIIGFFIYLSQFSIPVNTANNIIGATLLASLFVMPCVLMIIGAVIDE